MTYYQESQFLDLRKKYNAFSYTKLVDKQEEEQQKELSLLDANKAHWLGLDDANLRVEQERRSRQRRCNSCSSRPKKQAEKSAHLDWHS